MKSILVCVNGTAGDRTVLHAALQVGRLFNAHLHCLHVEPDRASLIGRAANVELTSAMLLTDAVRALEAEAAKRREHARAAFFAFSEDGHLPTLEQPQSSASVSVSWHEETGKPANRLLYEARFHDLVVASNAGGRDVIFSEDDLGRLVVSAGRPLLLVPSVMRDAAFKRIGIAWKSCPEAARAVIAALPLLEKAGTITVFNVNEQTGEAEARNLALDEVKTYLEWHALSARTVVVEPGSEDVCEAVMNRAVDARIDLLVMGGFGRSRLSEFVLGGFTQRILDGCPLPVLIFH